MTVTVSINAAQNDLSSLIDQAAAGEDVVISRSGKPVARLVAVQPARKARNGGAAARAADAGIDPLSEDIRRAFVSRYRA